MQVLHLEQKFPVLSNMSNTYCSSASLSMIKHDALKGIYPEFQVIRGFSQKIPAGLLSYDQIHS